MPRLGLILNDGKELSVETALHIQNRFEKSGYEVIRASSSGGMVGFANPGGKYELKVETLPKVPEGCPFHSEPILSHVSSIKTS